MKKLSKLKKNIVINTKYIEKSIFNQPIYILDSNKDFVKFYKLDKKNTVNINELKIEDNLSEKTFITIKEFFKKCKKDNTEYKIEKVNNGDTYIRIAYFKDISLFFKINENKTSFILTNINKYKFYSTNNNIQQAFNNLKYLTYYEKVRTEAYLKNLKNIKRDYLFESNKALNLLQKKLANQ